ncbi:SET domain-containing protein [Cucurbitaria berberidis CBS 394.84]|uniref:SET domain-containing protein n=1 Tax=Cucurbitaria berberidis CBS 394.84 TaxID=1168544 RepID=A0A9P4GS43_9PLEO|nr:SET domain-containing protein [Cucurbitaria berberidis CBS 394.84]KAF1850514.1 SET domain-containing protein [Cucurbitaria berberidis CBS 394.84]
MHTPSVTSSCKCAFTLPSPQLVDHTCRGPPEVYTVEPSQGKGLGVFALHDVEIGDIVMRETPVVKISPPDFVKGTGYPMAAISKLVRQEFETLSLDKQAEILSLTYHATPAEIETMDQLGLIFRTNAYNTGKEIGLFPKIARINHSCRPNTSYYWSERLNKRIVYATRKIKQGEEFSVSYIPLLLTQKERQARLDRYGFKCHCEACAQERAATEVSDERRVTINQAFIDFEPQLILTPPKSKTATRQARKNANASLQLASLVQEEGLADYYAKAYRIAAISHARVGDWEPAAIWANKGYELKVMEDPQSPHTLELHHLTSNFLSNWESQLRNRSAMHGGQ